MWNSSVTTSANLIEKITLTTTTSTTTSARAISTSRIRPSAFAPRLEAPNLSFNYANLFGIPTSFTITNQQNPPPKPQHPNREFAFPGPPSRVLADTAQGTRNTLILPTISEDPNPFLFPTVRDSEEKTRRKISLSTSPKKPMYRQQLSQNLKIGSNTDTDLDNELRN